MACSTAIKNSTVVLNETSPTSTSKIRTISQAFKYTWDNKWKFQRSAKTCQARINKIYSVFPKTLPLSKFSTLDNWIYLRTQLLENENITNATVNRALSVLSASIRFTYDAQLHSTKVPRLPKLEELKYRHQYFSKEEVKHLVATAVDVFNNQALADAIQFSAYTGLRQGELLALKNEDVDEDIGVIWVGGRSDAITKSGNVRQVPISDNLKPIIARRRSNYLLFGDDWNNKDHLYNHFKKLRYQCGIDNKKVWHSLRHSFATWLGESAHPRTIQGLLGHSKIETTLRYCQPTEKAKFEAISHL